MARSCDDDEWFYTVTRTNGLNGFNRFSNGFKNYSTRAADLKVAEFFFFFFFSIPTTFERFLHKHSYRKIKAVRCAYKCCTQVIKLQAYDVTQSLPVGHYNWVFLAWSKQYYHKSLNVVTNWQISSDDKIIPFSATKNRRIPFIDINYNFFLITTPHIKLNKNIKFSFYR